MCAICSSVDVQQVVALWVSHADTALVGNVYASICGCWWWHSFDRSSPCCAVLLCCCRSKEALQAWAYKHIPDTLPELWGWVIFVLISMFAVSCINTLAQSYKVWLDEQEAEAQQQRRVKQQ